MSEYLKCRVLICPFPALVKMQKCVLSTRKMQNVSDRGRARSVSAATPRGNEPLAVQYGEPGAIFLRCKHRNFAVERCFEVLRKAAKFVAHCEVVLLKRRNQFYRFFEWIGTSQVLLE